MLLLLEAALLDYLVHDLLGAPPERAAPLLGRRRPAPGLGEALDGRGHESSKADERMAPVTRAYRAMNQPIEEASGRSPAAPRQARRMPVDPKAKAQNKPREPCQP